MARASAAVAWQTAQEILRSGTELFAARGFAEVSLEDVAQVAGVTRGAVYHHYGSKAGLFRAVTARLHTEVAEVVVAAAQQAGPDSRSQLRAGCHAFLDAITDTSVARVLLLDAPAVIGWVQWRELDAQTSETHLREALTDVGVPAPLVDAMTVQLSGAMNEAALWITQQARGTDARQQAHDALDRLLEAVIA